MADFKTHLTTSSFMGIAYGGVAHAFFDVPLPTSVLAGGLCAVSGMLPDIDSGSGKPLRESLAFAAAVIPMMLADRLKQLDNDMSPEWIILIGAFVYLMVRFGLAEMLKKYTVHRGMFHSLPAAIIFGEVAFLLASGSVELRFYKAGAVVIGYISHLMLDELYSIEWRRGRLRLKKSFGTAMKVYSHKWWANTSTYMKLGLLSYIVLYEPGWMEKLQEQHLDKRVAEWAETLTDQVDDSGVVNTANTEEASPQRQAGEDRDGLEPRTAETETQSRGYWRR